MHPPSLLSHVSFLSFFLLRFVTVHATNVDVSKVIQNLKLSPDAQIFLRDEPGYAERTKRWQYWKAPDIAAVVEVTTTEDVAETVRFANTHSIPFTAFSGGHGGISSLGAIENGIQINLRKLNVTTISADNTYATVGGGVKAKDFRDFLWSQNKWTVHGCCECTGLTAVGLGGGHGLLQGRYGLLADQILSMEVVLANGTVVTVSEAENSGLFWAMRGAGHNFGIVTSLEWKIYQIPETQEGGRVWSYEAFTYDATPENVNKVYGLAKGVLEGGQQPDGLFLYGVISLDPATGKVVILHHVFWNGPLSTIRKHTQAYHALSPRAVAGEQGTCLDQPRWMAVDLTAAPCRVSDLIPGAGILRFPVDTKTYNLDALAETTEKFSELVKSRPEFAASFIMIEQYPSRAVREADRRKSVVPWRDDGLLVAPALLYPSLNVSTTPPTSNADLDEIAWKKGEEMRQIMVDGAEADGGHHSYVNYAYGGEQEKEWYGEENLERLRKLKRVYDPGNRFGFYAPIDGKTGEIKREIRSEL